MRVFSILPWLKGIFKWTKQEKHLLQPSRGKVIHSRVQSSFSPGHWSHSSSSCLKRLCGGVLVGTCPRRRNCWDSLPPCGHAVGTIADIAQSLPRAMDIRHMDDCSFCEGGDPWSWHCSDRSKWTCVSWRTDIVFIPPPKKILTQKDLMTTF